jgi:hypothetical protein
MLGGGPAIFSQPAVVYRKRGLLRGAVIESEDRHTIVRKQNLGLDAVALLIG